VSLRAQPSGKQRAKGRHRRLSAVRKAARRAGIAAPVVVASGAMAFMAAPLAHQALGQTSPHTITARLDAVVQPAAPAAPAAHAARTHTVQAGDTLYGIALRYYGHGKYWPALYQANQSQISDPNLIYVGQVLTIPQSHTASWTPPPATPATPTTSTPTTPAPTTTTTSTTDQSPATSAATTQDAASMQPMPPTGGSTQPPTQPPAGGSTALQSDIADGDYLLAIGQYLVDNGYSAAAAAGVASCIDGESGGNPESLGDGGGGLIGWTPLSSAAPNANIVTGDAATDILTQLADILYYNTNEIGQSQVDELNAQTDPVAAADFYSQNFERPAVTDSDVVPAVAEQVFTQLGG
jgi:LysM repeat protein